MANIPILATRVRHIGILDLGEFYRQLSRWFNFNGYKFEEEQYLEKISPDGKIYELIWTSKKNKSTYFTYHIDVEYTLIGIKDVEVQQQGKRIKLQHGDFDMRIKAYIEKSESGNKYWRFIYENFIIRKRIDEYKAELEDKAVSLIDWMKEFFNQYVL